MSDAEFCSGFPTSPVFENAGEFCALLASMLERQMKHTDWYLCDENSGGVNIFYVRGIQGKTFTVIVTIFPNGTYCGIDVRPFNSQISENSRYVFSCVSPSASKAD